MKRKYKVNGKDFVVEEIQDVRAVKPAVKSPESFRSVENEIDANARSVFRELNTGLQVKSEELQAFSNAGWIFTKPSPEVRSRMGAGGNRPTGALPSNKVYKDAHDHLLIGTDRITVKFKPRLSQQDIDSKVRHYNMNVLRKFEFGNNLYELSTPEDPIDAVNRLSGDPAIVFAEPVMLAHIPQRFRPTDPLYKKQWQLANNGMNGLKKNADISAEAAWELSRGKGIRIAIIDNGFEVNHPDLKNAIHPLSGYFDRRGVFVRGVSGFPNDGHGTFCAGMAVARESNGVGITGVAPLADFMAIACLGDQVGSQVTLSQAIAYAAEPTLEDPSLASGSGADVISCSLGPNDADWKMESILREAIDFAVEKGRNGLGTPVFWAVSNGNFPINGPAGADEVSAYDHTISVGRSSSADREHGSAYGKELDFLAPGADVFSTTAGGQYGFSTGTSFAAPLASGIAALILAAKPNLGWKELRQVMRDSCDKIGNVSYTQGRHLRYGSGRLNAHAAIQAVLSSPAIRNGAKKRRSGSAV